MRRLARAVGDGRCGDEDRLKSGDHRPRLLRSFFIWSSCFSHVVYQVSLPVIITGSEMRPSSTKKVFLQSERTFGAVIAVRRSPRLRSALVGHRCGTCRSSNRAVLLVFPGRIKLPRRRSVHVALGRVWMLLQTGSTSFNTLNTANLPGTNAVRSTLPPCPLVRYTYI